MKSINSKYLLILTIAMFSCKSDYAADKDLQTEMNTQQIDIGAVTNTQLANDNYVYFEDTDKSLGMVASRIKLPKGWKRSNAQGFAFEGPNNMRIGNLQNSKNFFYTEDYNMAASYQMAGVQNLAPYSMDQIIQEFFMPYASQNGMRLVKTSILNKPAEKQKAFMESLFKSEPTRVQVDAVGVEWADNNNKKYYTVLRRVIYYRSNQLSWYFNNQHVESPAALFSQAKQIHLDGIMSEEFNLEYIHVRNKQAAQKSRQMYQESQARLAAMRLNTTNSSYNKSVGDTYSEILDINHSGYLKNSNIQYGGHKKSVNMIAGQTVIGNHNTGEHFNVQSGSKYYWVNQDGKYIGTDNINYDPRMDKRINNVEWSKFNIEN